MTAPDRAVSLEEQIGQWRCHVRKREAIHAVDVAELEDHLREQIAGLVDRGLSHDEAFLVAVKRMGDLDALSREFAREHSERLWKHLVVAHADSRESPARTRMDLMVACGFALAAAVAIKVPGLFRLSIEQDDSTAFYARNIGLFVLPALAAYFVWKRGLDTVTTRWLAVAFAAATVFVNGYPFTPRGDTEAIAALHLPIVLWLLVGVAYTGGRWRDGASRMDFIRFTGELLIYCALIAIGGAILTTFMLAIFNLIGVDAQPLFEAWLLPCGAMAGIVIAARLVEAKQSVIENMAPVLTRLFTPLFAAVLLVFLVTMLWTGRGVGIERNVLIAFDTLLVMVLGLLLYSVSARDPHAPPGAFDVVQVVLVVIALLVNAVALWAITARITRFGLTPNRTAVLGENLVLLVNLAWSAVLYIRFLRGRGSFTSLEKWQTDYVPVYGVWAAIVVIVLPPLFGYI